MSCKSFVCTASFCLMLASSCLAVDWESLHRKGYLSDFANVASAECQVEMERYGKQVEDKTGVRLDVVIVSSLQGEPVEEVAALVFKNFAPEDAPENRAPRVMLFLAAADRRSRLLTDRSLSDRMPADFEAEVLDRMTSSLWRDDHGQAVLAAADAIGGEVARAVGRPLDVHPNRRDVETPALRRVPWVLVAAVLLVGFVMLAGSARRGGWRGMIYGNLLGRPKAGAYSRGHFGGGFGGYDSPDGAGAFGGETHSGRW